MKKQTCRYQMHNRLWAALLLFLLCFSGCGRHETSTPQGTPSPFVPDSDAAAPTDLPSDALTPETESLFCQILLFLQEGFRRHDIHKTYQIYFTMPDRAYTDDDGNTVMHCDLLLKDTDAKETNAIYWYENLNYTFDEDSGWYTITWQYESVMTQNDEFAYDADSSFVKELLENCIYETTLSWDAVVEAPIRYYAPSGPFVFDGFCTTSPYFPTPTPNWLYTRLYLYQDDRMGVYVTIHYPVLSISDSRLNESLNAKIRDAFFYGYDWDEEPNLLMPEKEILTSIERNYFVTREDEQYFSVRIYEYYEARRAAHPCENETGLTLSLETGEALTLRDIVGEKYTLEQLLDSGAFHCMWGDFSDPLNEEWMAEADVEWIAKIAEEYQYHELEDFDTDFYLTDDSLGLIATIYGDEYICIEAKLSDLGLEEWIAAN